LPSAAVRAGARTRYALRHALNCRDGGANSMSEKEKYELRKAKRETALKERQAENWWSRFTDPNSVQALLAFCTLGLTVCTAGLIIVGLQQKWVLDGQRLVLERTDETMKRTMINSQRAYLVFQNARILEWTVPAKSGTTVAFDAVNIGTTPAYNVKQRLYIDLRKPPVLDYAGIPWANVNDINYVAKGFQIQKLEGPFLDKTKALKGSINTKDERLYFIGRVEYEDIFSLHRWTDFCFMYLGEEHLKLSNCDYLNDADHEGHERRHERQP
jgi:hypothetical protein